MGGLGGSWAVPVYILNGNFPDEFAGEEDPVPFDGEPHPEHGPPVMGANPMFPDWQGEQQGADAGLGAHGGNPRPNPVQHMNQSGHGDAAPAANIEGVWPAWEPANIEIQEPPMQPPEAEEEQIQPVPHHPLNP